MVAVFGDRFSRYISADGEELDDEEEELLFCELTLWLVEDEEGVELGGVDEEELDDWGVDEDEELDELLLCELDDTCCSICCGEEYSTLKLLSSNTTVSTEVG